MASDELSDNAFDDAPERCAICRQEYQGFCPLNSSACPYDDPTAAEDDPDDDDEDVPDFEDVKHVDQLLKEDVEALRLIDEADGETMPKDLLEEVEAEDDPKD